MTFLFLIGNSRAPSLSVTNWTEWYLWPTVDKHILLLFIVFFDHKQAPKYRISKSRRIRDSWRPRGFPQRENLPSPLFGCVNPSSLNSGDLTFLCSPSLFSGKKIDYHSQILVSKTLLILLLKQSYLIKAI